MPSSTDPHSEVVLWEGGSSVPASPLTRLHSEPTEPQKVLCPLVFKNLENENTYITILFVNFSSVFNTPPWSWLANSALQDSTPCFATGYWTSSQTESRQFELAVTPPPLYSLTVCSVPSSSCCTVMTALAGMKRTLRWNNTSIVHHITNNNVS